MATVGGTAAIAPPASHTEAQNTKAQVVLDWFSVTLPYSEGERFIEAQALETTALDHGYYGYTHGATALDGALILWSPGRQEMGYHFSINGRSLCLLPDVGGFMRAALASGGKVTRLDVALDDRAGLLDWETVERAVRRVELTSRWKHAKIADDVDFASGAVDGRIVRFGSRASRACARLYDKRQEQVAKGEPDPGHWLRFECEFRDRDADTLARLCLDGDWRAVVGVIAGYLSFRDPDPKDTNKSRWPVAAWWASFLGHVARAKGLFRLEPCRTIEDVKKWLMRQVGPSVALVLESAGGDLEFLARLADAGRSRWRTKHRAILATAPVGSVYCG